MDAHKDIIEKRAQNFGEHTSEFDKLLENVPGDEIIFKPGEIPTQSRLENAFRNIGNISMENKMQVLNQIDKQSYLFTISKHILPTWEREKKIFKHWRLKQVQVLQCSACTHYAKLSHNRFRCHPRSPRVFLSQKKFGRQNLTKRFMHGPLANE